MSSLITREAAEQRLFAFFNDIDWWRHDRIAMHFTPDGTFSFAASRQDREQGLHNEASGRDNVALMLTSAYTNISQTHHTVSNITTVVSGETARSTIHMRAHHKGAGPVAHMFQESLATAELLFGVEGYDVKIAAFHYTILISLGDISILAPAAEQER